MPFGFFSATIQLVSSLFLSILESRIGQIAIAVAVGWIMGWWDTSASWKAKVEADRQAIERQHQAEIIRQQRAAADIAQEAVNRIEEDQRVVDDLRRQIEEFNSKETTLVPAPTPKTLPHASTNGCAIDNSFADVVRQLDRTGKDRKSRPTRRAR